MISTLTLLRKPLGKKSLILNLASTVSADEEIDIINRKYDNYPSIRKIKANVSPFSQFSLNYATEDTILRILFSLDFSREAGYDTLPLKIIKLAAPIIVTQLTKIINLSISVSKYPDMLKEACITLVFKKDDRLRKENYRPISILNTFSKAFERYILEQLTPFFNVTISTYRKSFRCQNVLLRLIEQWR